MRDVVATVERVLALPAVRDAVLSRAPDVARVVHGADGSDGPRGVFLGYDFHVGPAGPQLIEINTNAGGALLNAALGAALEACCPEVEVVMAAALAGESPGFGAFEDEVVAMFRSEWRLARGDAPLARIAIVDDEPRAQYLHPEFLLFRELFGRAGLAAVVADPAELERRDGRLWCAGAPVDLVYNRLTDFALAEPRNAAVRDQLDDIAQGLDAIDPAGASLTTRVRWRLDRALVAAARRARDPMPLLWRGLGRAPLSTFWQAWREARRG